MSEYADTFIISTSKLRELEVLKDFLSHIDNGLVLAILPWNPQTDKEDCPKEFRGRGMVIGKEFLHDGVDFGDMFVDLIKKRIEELECDQ